MLELQQAGAPIDIDMVAFEGVMNTALDMLSGRGLIELEQGRYHCRDENLPVLSYYANSINHWQDERVA